MMRHSPQDSSQFNVVGGAGSAVTGATTGAALGTPLGLPGQIIGGTIGGIYGLLEGGGSQTPSLTAQAGEMEAAKGLFAEARKKAKEKAAAEMLKKLATG
tara:strand:- start:56 stop:355 length:300 start_codon:yes stop_codon:yes gene_type:complete